MSTIHPLKKAKALGSAKDGTGHWLNQRISAVALLFLIAWVVYAVLAIAPMDAGRVIEFLHQPYNAILLILLMSAVFYHGYLGIQVVIEDYIHAEGFKIFLLVFLKLASLFAVVSSTFVIFSIYLKG